ncbi:FISUMP domain-containing protein [Riemerella anatipestifer]|nr:FISUMP domain-containing protein [Riemerella anatipestifer]
MKKTLFCAMFLPLALQAQVGINTDDPKATLEVKKNTNLPNTQPQGVLFPKFTSEERLKFSGAAEVGTVIYNADKKCLEMYLGLDSGVHQWACLPDVGSSKAQSVAVSPQGFEGSYIGGVPFSNNSQKVKFKLENNSFSSVNSSFADAVSIQNGTANISITGCTWKLLPLGTGGGDCSGTSTINLASGQAALLTYTMGGTPEPGPLTTNFSKFGAQADQQIQVGLGSPTIMSPKKEYIISLTYAGISPIPGLLDNETNKLVVKIPYENGSGSYTAVDTAPITTAAGEGGDINTVKLTIPEGNFMAKGSLDATIVVGGTDSQYQVRLLQPGEEYEIATIPYTLNGQSYQLVLKGIGGIPDKKFGVQTNGKLEHQFIYIPVTVKGTYLVNGKPYSKEWLNLNLGADYANLDKPDVFNPTKQGTSATDHHAYGSLFQWGRDADGHELINWSSPSSGTPVNSLGWRSYDQLTTYNDPCPMGWHTPTNTELQDLHQALTNTRKGYSNSNTLWSNTQLRLPASGYRGRGIGSFGGQSSYGWLWSSEQYSSTNSWNLWFGSSYSYAGSSDTRSVGFGIRCIKD